MGGFFFSGKRARFVRGKAPAARQTDRRAPRSGAPARHTLCPAGSGLRLQVGGRPSFLPAAERRGPFHRTPARAHTALRAGASARQGPNTRTAAAAAASCAGSASILTLRGYARNPAAPARPSRPSTTAPRSRARPEPSPPAPCRAAAQAWPFHPTKARGGPRFHTCRRPGHIAASRCRTGSAAAPP